MDIKPVERTIRELLSAQKQYVIPRFQREYSWERRHYNEFFLDMVSNLSVHDGIVSATPYFMGTMLFVGDAEDKAQRQSEVVDGQQRLTTITILFSALTKIFTDVGETKLADNLFRYIMTEDDNGQEVRILKTVTSYPYFSFFIQNIEKADADKPSTEEEKCIEDAYSYFERNLEERTLRKHLSKYMKGVDAVPYIEILKAIRTQILDSTIIEIYTSDNTVANKLFEILNAKGKKLSFIDLIKNKLFEHLSEVEPADFASETWGNISALINSGPERTGFATFFRQYWSSKYKRSTSSLIYNDFVKTVPKADYKAFLKDLKKEAVVYKSISNPTSETFGGKKQYNVIVQKLRTFNNYFNVIQVRVPLLALFSVKEKGYIKLGKLEKVVNYLEGFHFAYNSILSKSPNRVEPIYSRFSIKLRSCESAQEVDDVINNDLILPLDKLYPKYHEFIKGFLNLCYSKKDSPLNMKTKYAVNKLYSYYQKSALFDPDGSVEHIIPESDKKPESLNIGNLILLEVQLNSKAGDMCYSDKKVVYQDSKYNWVHSFINENATWNEQKISNRARELADCFYYKVLNRPKEKVAPQE